MSAIWKSKECAGCSKPYQEQCMELDDGLRNAILESLAQMKAAADRSQLECVELLEEGEAGTYAFDDACSTCEVNSARLEGAREIAQIVSRYTDGMLDEEPSPGRA